MRQFLKGLASIAGLVAIPFGMVAIPLMLTGGSPTYVDWRDKGGIYELNVRKTTSFSATVPDTVFVDTSRIRWEEDDSAGGLISNIVSFNNGAAGESTTATLSLAWDNTLPASGALSSITGLDIGGQTFDSTIRIMNFMAPYLRIIIGPTDLGTDGIADALASGYSWFFYVPRMTR